MGHNDFVLVWDLRTNVPYLLLCESHLFVFVFHCYHTTEANTFQRLLVVLCFTRIADARICEIEQLKIPISVEVDLGEDTGVIEFSSG